MKLPDREQFRYLDCVIGGDECWLINPKELGCTWNEDNLMFHDIQNLIKEYNLKNFIDISDEQK
jgi:hypothetical protein